jgi:hypothetical protein
MCVVEGSMIAVVFHRQYSLLSRLKHAGEMPKLTGQWRVRAFRLTVRSP